MWFTELQCDASTKQEPLDVNNKELVDIELDSGTVVKGRGMFESLEAGMSLGYSPPSSPSPSQKARRRLRSRAYRRSARGGGKSKYNNNMPQGSSTYTEFIRDCGLEIVTLMFDGLMIAEMNEDGQPRELTRVDCAWHCEMLNEICKHVLGIDMKWDTKPLVDKRVAVPVDFDPGSLQPLFDELVKDTAS